MASNSLSTSRSRRGESLCSNSSVSPCCSCDTKMLSPLPPPSLCLAHNSKQQELNVSAKTERLPVKGRQQFSGELSIPPEICKDCCNCSTRKLIQYVIQISNTSIPWQHKQSGKRIHLSCPFIPQSHPSPSQTGQLFQRIPHPALNTAGEEIPRTHS